MNESNAAQQNAAATADSMHSASSQQENFLEQQKLQQLDSECVQLTMTSKEKKIGIRYFLLFMLNGFLNVILTVVQIIYTSKTENFIYFIGCFMFGPLHIIAVLLAVSISKKNNFEI